jgi:hypothetical protein
LLLSEGIGELRSLLALDLYGCSSLKSLSAGLHVTEPAWRACSPNPPFTLNHPRTARPNPPLSAGLGQLKSLRTLNIEFCWQLEALPEGFQELSNLENLNLHCCCALEALPAGFGQLKSLTSLKLCGDDELSMSLKSLPEGFGQLKSLTYLDLSYCRELQALPAGFGQLESLHTLNLRMCYELKALPAGFRTQAQRNCRPSPQ